MQCCEALCDDDDECVRDEMAASMCTCYLEILVVTCIMVIAILGGSFAYFSGLVTFLPLEEGLVSLSFQGEPRRGVYELLEEERELVFCVLPFFCSFRLPGFRLCR